MLSENKDKPVTVLFTGSELEELKHITWLAHRSLSSFGREAILEAARELAKKQSRSKKEEAA